MRIPVYSIHTRGHHGWRLAQKKGLVLLQTQARRLRDVGQKCCPVQWCLQAGVCQKGGRL